MLPPIVVTRDDGLVAGEGVGLTRGVTPIAGVACLVPDKRSLVVMLGDELDGDSRGIVLREVSLLGGIILIGDWTGSGCVIVVAMDAAESTNRGGGGGISDVSMGSSLSDESDDPDSPLLLPLEDDPELLEELILFPFPLPPMDDGFLSLVMLTPFVDTDGINLGGRGICDWPIGSDTISLGVVTEVTVALATLFVPLLDVCLADEPRTDCFFVAPPLEATPPLVLGLLVTGPGSLLDTAGLDKEMNSFMHTVYVNSG